MAFDLRYASPTGAATQDVASGVPGKRTLTEGLSTSGTTGATAGTAIQRKPATTPVQDGNVGQQPGGTPPLDPAGAVINNLLQSFQRIDVEVPVPDVTAPPGQQWPDPPRRHTQAHVKAPYWNNTYVKPVDGVKREAPPEFDPDLRGVVLKQLGIGENQALAAGKARPEEISQAVTSAIALGLVARPGYAPVSDDSYWASAWRPVIERWMLKVGLGVDCSGFVYEALLDVQRETGAKTSKNAQGTERGVLDHYPDESSGRTLASDEGMGGQTPDNMGVEVNAPDELEVAVVMYFDSHIRILMKVDRTTPGITEFVTAESTYEGRYNAKPAGNGPRIHFWRYRDGALEHRYEGSTEWQPSLERPAYRRHLASTLPPAAAAGSNVQLKADPAAAANPTAAVAAAGPGAPLPEPTRRQMERSFGADFTGVRVHQGDAAPALGAQAFADGEHVHFAPGRYAPGSPAGDALLGHELAHVVQQRNGRVAAPPGKGTTVVDDPALEAEADRLGDAAAADRQGAAPAQAQAPALAQAGQTVQRKDDPGGGEGDVAPAAGDFDALLVAIDLILTQPRAAGEPAPVAKLHGPVSQLVAWCRGHLPDQAQIRSYLDSPATRDDKIRILGRLGSELARMEFMLGGLFNGVPSGTSWRTDEGSAELFPATYLNAAGSLSGGGDWCTSFAGYGFGRLGAEDGVTDYLASGPKQREHGAVVLPQSSLSVLRQLIEFWANDAGRHDAITTVADLVQQFLVDAPAVLARVDAPLPDSRRTKFEQYLYNKRLDGLVPVMQAGELPTTIPQIGDLLILNPRGPAVGGGDDHTAMVDRFAFPMLSTVEGNINNGTATRQLDLTNPEHLDQLYFITRPAQQIVDPQPGQVTAPPAPTGAGDPGAGIVQLLVLRAHNERLHAVFSKLSGNTTPYNAPVHDWGH